MTVVFSGGSWYTGMLVSVGVSDVQWAETSMRLVLYINYIIYIATPTRINYQNAQCDHGTSGYFTTIRSASDLMHMQHGLRAKYRTFERLSSQKHQKQRFELFSTRNDCILTTCSLVISCLTRCTQTAPELCMEGIYCTFGHSWQDEKATYSENTHTNTVKEEKC